MRPIRPTIQPRRSISLLEWPKSIVQASMPRGIILVGCPRPTRLISRKPSSMELMFATPGENSPTMNGSTSLDNAVNSLLEQSASLTGAEAMEAEDVDDAVAVVAKAAVTGTMVAAEVAETKMPLATTNKL